MTISGANRWIALSVLLLFGASAPWPAAHAGTDTELENSRSCSKPKVYGDLTADDVQDIIAAVARRTRLRVVKIGRDPDQFGDKLPPGVVEVAVLKKGDCVEGFGVQYWVKKRGARWRVVKRAGDVAFVVIR